jgi:hypothetical protein
MNGKQMIRISLLLIFFCSKSFAQQGIVNYQSFALDHKEAVWMQVYHADTINNLKEKLFNHLKRKIWISDIHYDGDDIIAEVVNYRPDYKRYGGKYMNTSNNIRRGVWAGKVRISFKEGKYRVFLHGLNYVAKQSATGSGKATIEQHDVSGTLSEWALNNYRSGFRKKRLTSLDILHFSFKDSFTLTLNQLIDSDW